MCEVVSAEHGLQRMSIGGTMLAVMGESHRYGMEINRVGSVWIVIAYRHTPDYIPQIIASHEGGLLRGMLKAYRAVRRDAQ